MVPPRELIVLVIRIALGGTFVFSGTVKLFDLGGFASNLAVWGFDWGMFSIIVVVLISLIELMAGICLMLGLLIKTASSVLGALVLLFIAVIIPQVTVGSVIDCGCFGSVLERKVDALLLLSDFVLLGAAAIVYSREHHSYSLQAFLQGLF